MTKNELKISLNNITNFSDYNAINEKPEVVYDYLQTNPSDSDMREIATYVAKFLMSDCGLGFKAARIRGIFNLHPGGIFNHANWDKIGLDIWNNPFRFTSVLLDELNSKKGHHALGLVYETVGHRYGDLFLLGDEKSSNDMLAYYHKAVEESAVANEMDLSRDISQYAKKQYVTPYFWASEYFFVVRNVTKYNDLSIKYLKLYLIHLDQALNDHLHPGELLKLHQSIFKLRYLVSEWEDWLDTNINNRKVQRTINTVKKYLYGWPNNRLTRFVDKTFKTSPDFQTDNYIDVLASSIKAQNTP